MTTDRLDQLRTEYAETGAVTSDGAVWLFSQIVVLREQLASLQAAAPPAPADRAAVLREAADTAYRIARRLDDQHHDERAQGAWDVENTLRAEGADRG